jgi:uncharacterized protein (DUF433 family)
MASEANPPIESTPGVCGGKPRLAGSRIRVQDVAAWYEVLGLSPDEIVAEHPGLSLGAVHAALAYYYDHRDAIHRDFREGETLAAELRGRMPSKLLQHLSGNEADAGSVSSG